MGKNDTPFYHNMKTGSLILAALILTSAGFGLGFLTGSRSNDGQNAELKQTVSRQGQAIRNLTDTIIIMKQSQKDTITSLHEPSNFNKD